MTLDAFGGSTTSWSIAITPWSKAIRCWKEFPLGAAVKIVV
jgi:hypothetical protein